MAHQELLNRMVLQGLKTAAISQGRTGAMAGKILLLASLLTALMVSNASAGWLIYHKPAFEGQILDGETKVPVEGAAVVVLYNKGTIGLGAGTLSSVINIRETVTDKEGRFRIPSYTTVIQPFSWEDPANFIIFKPGYVSVGHLYDRDLEGLFSGKMVGMQEQEIEWLYNKSLLIRYTPPNIVEIPRVRTNEERVRAIPARDQELREMAPIIIRFINDERAFLLRR